ncbi:MAG: sugar transferase [Chloroflexota bacterium]|nr:sugar transferase [Chloroflexota bacterium]
MWTAVDDSGSGSCAFFTTCLWQVWARNAISDFNDWVKLDLEYIDNWSLWLDIKILLWTATAVLAGTGK